jgi:protein gp37
MAQNTNISWTDSTFNPWIGCAKIADACRDCYAETWAKRYRFVGWGHGVPRRRTSPGYWRQPLKPDYGRHVFCASLADVFDNEVDPSWRTDLWALIKATPHLWWMLVTKRIGNAPKMLPPDWPYPHVGVIATLENQEVFDRDWPKLARLPAAWRGVSAEPLLGPINLGAARPDRMIVGGESGPGRRPMKPSWVRSLRDQCRAVRVRFHFKQWGGRLPDSNGCALDGLEIKEFPAAHD